MENRQKKDENPTAKELSIMVNWTWKWALEWIAHTC